MAISFHRFLFLLSPALLALSLVATAGAADEDLLPDAPGKAETVRLCATCHDLGKAVSIRQDRNGWGASLLKMVNFGMEATDEELNVMLAYLTEHFPPQQLPPVNINTARAIQLEARLTLKRSEAAAIIQYRKEHGDFESIEDVLKVPGIDAAKITAKKDRIAF